MFRILNYEGDTWVHQCEQDLYSKRRDFSFSFSFQTLTVRKTERKKARRQLRALKKSLFDTSSTSGYWIHSMQADVVFACVRR